MGTFIRTIQLNSQSNVTKSDAKQLKKRWKNEKSRASVLQCLELLNLARKLLKYLWRSILFDSNYSLAFYPLGMAFLCVCSLLYPQNLEIHNFSRSQV